MAPAKTKIQPVSHNINAEDTAAPLADYFFICGIESAQVLEDKTPSYAQPPLSPPVEDTIDENKELETDNARPTTPGSPRRGPGERLRPTC